MIGSTGFLGRRVVAELDARSDVEVVAACRGPRLLPAHLQASARVGDLRDPAYVARLFNGVDVVCLTAAWSALYGHSRESAEFYLQPLSRVLEAATAAGVPRVVMTSALQAKAASSSRFRAVRERMDSVWPHFANLQRLETLMQTLASPRTSMVSVRLGTFCGEGQRLGILPVLLPRLQQRVVPWIDAGQAVLPLIDGADAARAFASAALGPIERPFETLEATGPAVPTFSELVHYLHDEFDVPLPRFSVPGALAFGFGHAAEMFARLTRTTPLLTRSIVFLAEPCQEDRSSWAGWSYQPRVHWRESVAQQVRDLQRKSLPIRMADPITPLVQGATT